MRMRLLLTKDVPKLGYVGDVVEVSPGYGRNYLLPHHLAVEPTPANLKRVEELKRIAEAEREARRQQLTELANRLTGVEVTIAAVANPEGHLYGSVGRREIARALNDLGYPVRPEEVMLEHPIKQLDSLTVPVRLSEEHQVEIKVWVVREKEAGVIEDEGEPEGEEAEGAAASEQ